jgi:hypothetical protein
MSTHGWAATAELTAAVMLVLSVAVEELRQVLAGPNATAPL